MLGTWTSHPHDYSLLSSFKIAPSSRALSVGILSERNINANVLPDIAKSSGNDLKTGFAICMIFEASDNSIQALYGVETVNKTSTSTFGSSFKMYNITSKLRSPRQVKTPERHDFSPGSGFRFTSPITNLVPTYGPAPIGNELIFGIFSQSPNIKGSSQYSRVESLGHDNPSEGDDLLRVHSLAVRYDGRISKKGGPCSYSKV